MTFDPAAMPQFPTVFGRDLLRETEAFVAEPFLVVTMADLWPLFKDQLPQGARPYIVRSLERPALEADLAEASQTASIVGLGGGQAIDVAKYFAWRTGRPLDQFPTSLSVDAAWGQRSGVRENSRVRYVGFAVPRCVYIDLDIIDAAPRILNVGGMGDVLCFITGVMDWRFAHERGRCEPRFAFDEALAALSLEKAEAALAELDEVAALTPRGIALVVDGLRWGGASYHGAGWNPRHIEGIEHHIFQVLEAHTHVPFPHGQVVCLGVVLGAVMHRQREDELLDVVRQLAIDIRPAAMGITWHDVGVALKDLQRFVTEEGLPFGIAHAFDMSDAFLNEVEARIEASFADVGRDATGSASAAS